MIWEVRGIAQVSAFLTIPGCCWCCKHGTLIIKSPATLLVCKNQQYLQTSVATSVFNVLIHQLLPYHSSQFAILSIHLFILFCYLHISSFRIGNISILATILFVTCSTKSTKTYKPEHRRTSGTWLSRTNELKPRAATREAEMRPSVKYSIPQWLRNEQTK